MTEQCSLSLSLVMSPNSHDSTLSNPTPSQNHHKPTNLDTLLSWDPIQCTLPLSAVHKLTTASCDTFGETAFRKATVKTSWKHYNYGSREWRTCFLYSEARSNRFLKNVHTIQLSHLISARLSGNCAGGTLSLYTFIFLKGLCKYDDLEKLNKQKSTLC
jgi:hypothetical protein